MQGSSLMRRASSRAVSLTPTSTLTRPAACEASRRCSIRRAISCATCSANGATKNHVSTTLREYMDVSLVANAMNSSTPTTFSQLATIARLGAKNDNRARPLASGSSPKAQIETSIATPASVA